MEKSFKSVAVNYGLYLGVLLALLTAVPYIIDLSLLAKSWTLLIVMVLSIITLGILSIVKAKKILGGFITFKDAFTAFFNISNERTFSVSKTIVHD